MRNLLTPLLYICVGALLSMMLTRLCSKPKEITTEIVKTDTLTIVRVDTIQIVQPQAVKIIRDTVKITDTITIAGQTFFRETKEYQDSTYYARISGINAFLEEIRVYPQTTIKYITNTEKVYQKPKKWGVGPIAGVGIMGNKLSPFFGFGITYNIIQF